MPRTFLWIPAAGMFLLALSGCDGLIKKPKPASPQVVIPPHVVGTVAQHARLETGGELQVQGYGLAIGLGKNGSTQVPPHLVEYFKQYLARQGIGSYLAGLEHMTAEKMLRDPDTAVVLLGGAVPPGAPEGTRFDVYVAALPNTDARSLDGGGLLPSELRLAAGGLAVPGGPTRTLATAAGDVFINPFIDPNKPADQVKLREGRLIGGGKTVEARFTRLILYQPEYAMAQHIQRKLNERFGSPDPVASAKDSATIDLRIPPAWRRNYLHFLELAMHLPIGMGPGETEAHARQIAAAMELPGANHSELALVWEAIGKHVLPIVQNLYASRNATTSFYAARTGLRLGDDTVAGDIVIRFAQTGGSPLQVSAIHELGRTPSLFRATPVLHKLLDDENDMVRVAAYEALLRRGDKGMITRIDVGEQFKLDLVASTRGFVIYATQTQEPRIVLFGRDMPVQRVLFFELPDELVTISSRKGDEKLTLFRKIPRTGRYSDALTCDFTVRSLILTLGLPSEKGPDGYVKGLNFTYGQVVRILSRMCEPSDKDARDADIDAKFVLQSLPGIQRIFQEIGVGTVGRPDTPSD